MSNTKLESCPFEEPNGAYEIKTSKKKKTWFELVTASPSSLAYFCRDIRCNVGHYRFDEYPPCSEPEEMVKWLMQETDKEVY